MQTLELREHPEVMRVIRAAFPDYRKRQAFISPFPESGVNVNSYWDGGSRHVYALIHIESGQRKPLPTNTHPYFDIARKGMTNQETPDVLTDHVGNVTLKHLPDGIALVRGGTFCGKPATAHVYVPTANLAKYLPAGEK